jgi:uncharacterized protein YkwD
MSFALRITVATLLAALVFVPGAGGAVPACADADLAASSGNLRRVRAAIVCLHNRVRAQHDLPPLREDKRLRDAALAHSRDMVTDGYFDHTTPEGVTTVDRILRAKYAGKDDGWVLGENLGWGTGSLGTPRAAVVGWMRSPTHRANLLKRAYRDIGVGVALGVPASDAAGTTFTVDFGVRR